MRSKQTSSATQATASADSAASGRLATPALLGGGAETRAKTTKEEMLKEMNPRTGNTSPKALKATAALRPPGHPAGTTAAAMP